MPENENPSENRTLSASDAVPLNFSGEFIGWEHCRFHFLFCPNNSGSTIISQYLSVQLDGYLPPFGHNEGQMVPAVRAMMRKAPWDRASEFDWAFIRSAWEDLADGRVFIEASPPNIMRHDAIARQFGADSTAMISICSPYQYVASCLRRYNRPGTGVSRLASDWISKAEAIGEIRTSYPHFPFLSYEDFVRDPGQLNRLLHLPVRPFRKTGKSGSGARGIEDLSVRTSSFLTASEIDDINSVLDARDDLVESFGYQTVSGARYVESLKDRNEREFGIGRKRRSAWNRTRFLPSGLHKLKKYLPFARFSNRT